MIDDFFEHNRILKKMKKTPRWCVSDKDKRPIDMYQLKNFGKIWGVRKDLDYNPYVKFDEIQPILGVSCDKLKSVTYKLKSAVDDVFVLDIEADASNEQKTKLLQTPFIYAERSSSGKGFHLVFENTTVKTFSGFSDMINRTKVQKKDTTFEFLFNHHVTFTGNILNISPVSGNEVLIDALNEVYNEAKAYKPVIDTVTTEIILNDRDKKICKYLCEAVYLKNPEDVGDQSRYEFGMAAFYMHKLNKLLELPPFNKDEISTDEKINIVYNVLKKTLPKRNKHDEKRRGMPWLLYLTTQVFS